MSAAMAGTVNAANKATADKSFLLIDSPILLPNDGTTGPGRVCFDDAV